MSNVENTLRVSEEAAVPSRAETLVGQDAFDVEKGTPDGTNSQEEYGLKKPEHVIREGGWKAWSTVVGAWLVMVATFGYMSSFGIFETLYVEALLTNYSTATIGWIGGVQIFLLFATGIIAGKVFDAHYFRVPMVISSIVHIGCCFALSACQPGQFYQFFLAQALGQGFAMGMMYLPALAIVSHYFMQKRALAMGIVLTGSSVGSIVIPILLNNVLQSQGYAPSIRACGYFLIGLLVPANLLMFPNFNPEHREMKKVTVLELLRERVYVTGLVAALFTNIGLFFPNAFLQLWAVTHGVSQKFAFYLGAISNAGGILGRIVPNYLADRYGPVTCQIPAQYLCTILLFVLFAVQTQAGVIVYGLMYGLASGTVYSLFAPMLAVMANSMAEVGIRMGLASVVLGLAGLVGNPISGALIGNGPIEFTWWKAIVFNGVVLGCGATLMILLRYLLQQKKQKRWV